MVIGGDFNGDFGECAECILIQSMNHIAPQIHHQSHLRVSLTIFCSLYFCVFLRVWSS